MLIAPLDANSMAKIANGLCDNLLTCVVRAWDPRKPLFFAPAMNSAMWESPITYQQRKVLKDLLRYKVSDDTLIELLFFISRGSVIWKVLYCFGFRDFIGTASLDTL